MSLKKYYQEKSIPKLKEELRITNLHRLPRLSKVIISMGLSDARFDKKNIENCIKTLTLISGQKPLACKAKKAISNFKIRQGQVIAYMVTLRGNRMYDFVDKLINVVFPRIREFRGIPRYSFDKNGNLNLGIKEQVAFPEIKVEELEQMHGLQITIVTSAKNKKEAIALIKSLGGVISEEEKKKEEGLETIAEMRKSHEKEAKTSAEEYTKTAAATSKVKTEEK